MVNVTEIDSKKNEQKKNLKKLKEIQCALYLAIYGNPTPKLRIALYTALAAGVSYIAFCYFTGFDLHIFVALDIVLSLGFFAYIMNKRPNSWVTAIDELLNQYNPLDKAEYIRLQTYTKDNGFDYHYIMEWANLERQNYFKQERIDFTERNL
ncbi:hypothetical protein QMI71_004440 [Salmonella enterica]|nr:hypothetical protein [Salmonella enterica]